MQAARTSNTADQQEKSEGHSSGNSGRHVREHEETEWRARKSARAESERTRTSARDFPDRTGVSGGRQVQKNETNETDKKRESVSVREQDRRTKNNSAIKVHFAAVEYEIDRRCCKRAEKARL